MFDPECLTEDYENGWRIHALGCPQVFMPLRREGDGLLATREYFPHTFRTAVRQRARWVMGIVLQSWERRGWRAPARHLYWLWRDRKGVVGNLLAPVLNLLFVYGAATWGESEITGHLADWGAASGPEVAFLGDLRVVGLSDGRARLCSRRIYGWRFAMGVPVRALVGNWLNCAATVRALALYGDAKARASAGLGEDGARLSQPGGAGLEIRPLGQILVGSQYVMQADVDEALAAKAAGERIGEYLVRRGKLSEAELYLALSLQQNLPLAARMHRKFGAATRAVPAEVRGGGGCCRSGWWRDSCSWPGRSCLRRDDRDLRRSSRWKCGFTWSRRRTSRSWRGLIWARGWRTRLRGDADSGAGLNPGERRSLG